MENPDIAPNAARCRFRRIVVKVGSNVLTRADGTLDTDRMAALADQIAALHRAGVEVIVVSSGAVAAGRGVIAAGHRLDAVSARQLYSAVGQVKLIRRYYELFDARGIVCGQVLTTKQDFETRRHYLNQRNSIRVMLENGVVPIVNENDTVAVTELMFTDNDELSGLLSTMIGAKTALKGTIKSVLFMGVHYEFRIETGSFTWTVHSTDYVAPDTEISLEIVPDAIHIMHKSLKHDEQELLTEDEIADAAAAAEEE